LFLDLTYETEYFDLNQPKENLDKKIDIYLKNEELFINYKNQSLVTDIEKL
jgi:hypothetical protein